MLRSSARRARRARRPTSEHALDIPAAVASGAAIGLLGGIVGLILGSLRMPALLRLVGEVPLRAVGTNVAIGFFVGVAGALGHLPNAAPDLAPLLVGARRLDPRRAARLAPHGPPVGASADPRDRRRAAGRGASMVVEAIVR